ncbi:MAG: hypothetical protein JOZ57_04960 [Abitibacteriaceae bacterium]|nr:hypothetical protein [Abditibacteriaceae bacterium]
MGYDVLIFIIVMLIAIWIIAGGLRSLRYQRTANHKAIARHSITVEESDSGGYQVVE